MKGNKSLKYLTYTVMFIAINYVAFTYGKINIQFTAGQSTAIHIANAVVVLSSWLLGPIYGGLAGAVGLSLADLMDPRYITSAPKTFIMKSNWLSQLARVVRTFRWKRRKTIFSVMPSVWI